MDLLYTPTALVIKQLKKKVILKQDFLAVMTKESTESLKQERMLSVG